MNLALLDPFGQDIPHLILNTLIPPALPSTLSFSQRGEYLGAGTILGPVLIYDLDTLAICLELKGHSAAVTSLSWSSCNRYILSSSNDWNCILWDLKDGSRVATLRFDSPVLIAHLHPTDPFKLVAIAFGDEPYVITIGQEDSLYKTITKTVISLSTDAADNVKDLMASIVRFDPKGEHIFVGTTKGLLLVCDLDGKVQLTEKITSGSSLSSLYFSHSQRDMIVNATDRTLRVYTLSENEDHVLSLELINKFSDAVDRNQWVDCCFSPDDEYIIGGSSATDSHNIYMWDKTAGGLVKKLEGPKEGLIDLKWHPRRPIIASLSGFGTVFLWSVNYVQNFSAFAPSFTELEDNIEYRERETEFDAVEDEETMGSVDGETSEQLPPVDVFTISPEDAALAPFFIPSLC